MEDLRLRDIITLDNWRELAEAYDCPDCGRGVDEWTVQHNPNNNSYALHCACGQPHPLRQQRIIYLRHSDKVRREPAPESLLDTWARCGDYCYGCGRNRTELVALGVGLNQHHTPPYCKMGHGGILIPLCAWCHDAISLVQRIMARLVRP